MGLLEKLSTAKAGADVGAAVDRATAGFTGTVLDPGRYPLASPWVSSSLERIVFEDIFGTDLAVNSRADAMRVPALARGRNLIVSTICRLPLVDKTRDQITDTQPSWLRKAGNSSPEQRLAWTVDDLIFYGWSCWYWTRSAAASGRFPVDGVRLNQEDWSIDDDNRVRVRGTLVEDDQVVLIPGLHEGILSYGKEALSDVRSLNRNVRRRLTNPVPQIDLHQTSGPVLDTTARRELIAGWVAARNGENGGVAYTSPNVEARELGAQGEQLMIEERNAAAVDIARMLGVSAGMLDATTPKASLNYETQTGRLQEFIDVDLSLYMTPIVARLSLDDVTPRGRHIAFDLTETRTPTPSPTGPALED